MKKFFQNKIKLLISLTFLILFVFNTVAYSGLATKLAITSEAKFRPITDIRVTDIKLDSATNGAVESYSPKFNVDTTTTGFVLPNVNSTITYKVKVTNYGNVNQTIYNFIKNSINSSNVNIKITDFTSVCADDSCSQKNSDFTIIHHNGDNTTDSNEKEILITFSTSAPSDQAINVIEKYDFRPIYNINYDANGGQNAPKSQIKIYKDNLTLTTDEPTRPSYKFLGWSTSSKSTTAEYKAGDSYNPGTNEEVKDIILYAVWKIDSYTLTINPNGGTWNNSTNKSTITQSYGSTYIIENPTKTGYTFTGWTLSGKGSLNGTTYTFGEGAATLTANYTANTYTITLDNKSATTAGTTAIYEKYGAGIYLDSALKNVMTTTANPITKPSKTGYTFKGYYTKENGQGDQIINENGYITDKITSTTYTANTTLYAYYKDDIKPTLILTNSSNGNWTNKDVTITLNGADSGSGIKEYQWKENGAWTTRAIAITNGVGSITYTVDRNLEIEFRTIDNAGNVSDTKTTYVRRDTVVPKIELNGATSSSEINNSNNVTIPIKITETASGINNSEFTASDISVLINGTTVNPSTKTLTYNSVSNGVYSYTLTLSGITLNGKVTLEIVAGAVKDIATNSNSKTTLDPSITVSNIYTISLNGNGATTAGTSAIYERYASGIYLDSGTNSKQMTTSANPITKPSKSTYTISYNANNTGVNVSNASFTPSFNGYYTATSGGTQMINNSGYITSNLTNTRYTANSTWYAQWNHNYTLSSISKPGYTCSWNTKSDGTGTKYNSGATVSITANTTYYAVCTPNKYKVKFEPNGGTSSATEMDVTYDSPYGTLPTVTRSASKVNDITINYVFEGWYDSNGTKITETSIVETPSDHTLYAHWLSSPNIKGGTAESWSSSAITISLNIPSTSDTGTVSYQYYLSETNELPKSATWTDITSADGSVSISKNGEFYIFYKATSSAGVSITSNYNKLQIDTQTPSTSITAYQAGTTTTVASNKWINKNLEFKMGALNVGPSGGSIYYCIGDSCTPNTLISPNTAIPADLTNTKTGIYKVRYKAVSNAGLSSSIGEYVAKVDKTAPTMKAVVKSLKDNSTLANLTNSSTTYIDSTWRSYGYSINLNGTTDSQSGISSIERFTNANNLKRADADYKANLHKGVITDTKTFSESGDGAKYAKFVATDNAGNTTTFTVEVLIDKTAPTVGVNIYKAKDASTKTGSVICALPTSLSNGCKDAFPWTSYGYYFDFSPSSDELSGIDYYTMRYTAGGKSSVDTSSYEERNVHSAYTTVTSSGARRLEFTATDKAGNTSTVEAKNVYIDMDDPNLVIKLYKADSSGNKTGSVLKTITDNNTAINSWTNYRHYFDLSGSSDSLSGIEKITMQINDSGIVTTGNTATGTSDLKTTYTITSTKHQVVGSSGNRYARFTITDKVGNTSVKNVRIYIDLDAPTLNSASLSPQFQSSTTIKYTCSDKTSGFASFGTKTLSKTYTKNVTSSNSPVKIQCKDTAGNTSSGTRTYTWSANSDKCGTTTEDVYSNGYYCDAGNAASANSSACISYATNTGKTTKYVNKRCMYYCNAKTGTTTVAKTCWHQ